MYSYEGRMRAVALHIKLGKRAKDTIRQLGYPGRATLTAWVREAFPGTSKAVTGSDGRLRYPDALKKTGVVRLYNRQESAQALAEKLCLCRPTLYNWKNQLLCPEAPAIMKRKNNSQPVPERKELERQLETLQQDIQKLQLEHDLLKKLMKF